MLITATGLVDDVRECPSLVAALHEAEQAQERIGLVMLDLGLSDASGLQALERIRGALPDVPVLVVSGQEEAEIIDGAFARGARGYLPKGSSAVALRLAMESVLGGELYVPPQLLASFAARTIPTALADDVEGDCVSARLTPRQTDVLSLLARGFANKEIAQSLDMSPSTVRVHVSAILERLGVENRTQAATSAVAAALLARKKTSVRADAKVN